MDRNNTSKVIKNLFNIEKNVTDYDWQPFRDGVDIFHIYGNNRQGPSAALLRYSAGAEIPKHLHTDYEHILVLSGSQTDGFEVYNKGTLMISDPGSEHKITSETGCIVLAIWNSPVEFTSTI